jgi:hypothetical protein
MIEHNRTSHDDRAEGQGDASVATMDLATVAVNRSWRDAVGPGVTSLPLHNQDIARRQQDVRRGSVADASHGQYARRPEADGGDGVCEAGTTIHMMRNSLARKVFVDDDLIEGTRRETVGLQAVCEFASPGRKRAKEHVGIDGSTSVVVPVAVVLDSAPQVLPPRKLVNGGKQRALFLRTDIHLYALQARNPEVAGKVSHGAILRACGVQAETTGQGHMRDHVR